MRAIERKVYILLTKEQFNKMTYKERVDLFNSNKELYNQLK